MADRDLSHIRAEIDALDLELIEKLNLRANLAKEVGILKGDSGAPYFTPEREREVYERLTQANHGPLREAQLRGIFREIISAARALEQPLRCAFWGPPGSFSHLAASSMFGGSSVLAPVDSISEVFLAVEHGEAEYGVVPIENSLAGVVPETLDMFPVTNAKICAELYVPIDHQLVSVAASLDHIERLYVGPQPYHQCRRWIQEKLPHAAIVEMSPTSRAAQKALEDPAGAAIANALAADLLGIPVLVPHIQDSPTNRTRFLTVGFNEPKKTGRDKTSMMFNLRNKPGELYRALGAFVDNDVNLLMIESRPAQRSSFEYLFFVDCIGHRSDAGMGRAIEALKELALETTILGSYPSAE